MRIAVPMSKSKTQHYINQAYIDYLAEAGYEPILVTEHLDPNIVSADNDGLLLPGGSDLDPIFYYEDNYSSYLSDPEKDDFERQLFYSFKAVNKPVFGICRGFQLIVREFLRHHPDYEKHIFLYYQHIRDHTITEELNIARTQPSHSVVALKDVLYGEESSTKATRMFVNSMHHQGLIADLPRTSGKKSMMIMTIDNDVKVLAFTKLGIDSKKGSSVVIEAIEFCEWLGGGIRAVQWHPEELKDFALIQTFFGGAIEVGEETVGANQ